MSTQNLRKRIPSYLLYLLVKLFTIALTISSFLCFGVNTEGTNHNPSTTYQQMNSHVLLLSFLTLYLVLLRFRKTRFLNALF